MLAPISIPRLWARHSSQFPSGIRRFCLARKRLRLITREVNQLSKETTLVQRPIKKWAPLFILPTFLAFLIGFVWPFLQGIYLSFCKFNIFGFIGFNAVFQFSIRFGLPTIHTVYP